MDRATDLMVVKLSSWPDYLIYQFTLDTFLAIDAIRKVLAPERDVFRQT